MIRRNLYYFTPVLFFFLMLIDAHLTQIFIATSQNHYIWRAHLVLIAMLIAVKQLSKHYMITVALIIGSLFDLYYLGILGIYAVVFPVTIWLMYLIYGILFENDFNLFFGMIIFVTFFELFIVGLQLMFNLIRIDLIYFVTQLLAPTLLLNIGLYLLSMYPLKKIFWKK